MKFQLRRDMEKIPLTLKALSKIAADHIPFLLFFRKNKTWHFADDSHEMSSLKKCIKTSSAAFLE